MFKGPKIRDEGEDTWLLPSPFPFLIEPLVSSAGWTGGPGGWVTASKSFKHSKIAITFSVQLAFSHPAN